MNQTMDDDIMKEAKENPRKRKNRCDDKENENSAKFQTVEAEEETPMQTQPPTQAEILQQQPPPTPIPNAGGMVTQLLLELKSDVKQVLPMLPKLDAVCERNTEDDDHKAREH